MSYNGTGTFVINSTGQPVVSGTTITDTAFNALTADLATGLTNAITRDGQSPATANLPMGSNKITGLAAASSNGDAVRYEQLPSASNPLAVASGGTGAVTAAAARTALAAAASGANADITSLTALTSINGGPLAGFRNVAINGGFTINQRAYVSAAVLAAGAYAHDCWKAGAAGGDYSFTQLNSNTTITIAANKTLIQVVEDKNVDSTAYVVSWTGTALGRVGVNTATPSGSYAASPILIAGQTAGTTLSVEFGNGASAGTLGKVQIERGTVATSFEQRPFPIEAILCQRYCEYRGIVFIAGAPIYQTCMWKVNKAFAPTLTIISTGGTGATVVNLSFDTTGGFYQNVVNSVDSNAQVRGVAEL